MKTFRKLLNDNINSIKCHLWEPSFPGKNLYDVYRKIMREELFKQKDLGIRKGKYKETGHIIIQLRVFFFYHIWQERRNTVRFWIGYASYSNILLNIFHTLQMGDRGI